MKRSPWARVGWGALGVAAALGVSVGANPGCVQTAECDLSTPCSDEAEVCFDFECRRECDGEGGAMACAEGQVCASCAVTESCSDNARSACVEPIDEGEAGASR